MIEEITAIFDDYYAIGNDPELQNAVAGDILALVSERAESAVSAVLYQYDVDSQVAEAVLEVLRNSLA